MAEAGTTTVKRIGIVELNDDTAGILARVARGEPFEITSNDRPIARLTPVAAPLPAAPAPGAEPTARRSGREATVTGTDEIDLGIKDHESW